jgi:CheY-like chemotaxis protein/HPt (histidine-containing phosphotransfer) domain-containing protein
VVFAHDGAEALASVQREAFDMVLMDVQMPVMDGVEATRRIRGLAGAVRRIPIIGLTANVMSQEQSLYLQAGMNECLMKPIEWDRLAAAIARHSSAEARLAVAAIAGAGDEVAAPPSGDVPLLEERQIASLRELASESEAEFLRLMHDIMEAAQRAVDEIVAAVERAPMAAAAHRLKGSAGMGGLARISEIAGRLEDACASGDDVQGFGLQLAQTLKETRAALVGQGRLAG